MRSILFEECLQALEENVTILSLEETNKIFELFESNIPIYQGGSRIDWKKIKEHIALSSPKEITSSLEKLLKNTFDSTVYIFWNDASLPVIKTDLILAISKFEDVTAVGFETWFFNPWEGFIIEYYYLKELNIGLIK